jgi:hypothetical protein
VSIKGGAVLLNFEPDSSLQLSDINKDAIEIKTKLHPFNNKDPNNNKIIILAFLILFSKPQEGKTP